MEILDEVLLELENLKIRDLKLYNSEGNSILADYFIVSTSDSILQMDAARNRLIESMWKYKIGLKNPQEDWHGGWCLLDFGNIIVHIFLEETRSFYDIDSLLSSASFSMEEISALKESSV